jgi:hypothetical protein
MLDSVICDWLEPPAPLPPPQGPLKPPAKSSGGKAFEMFALMVWSGIYEDKDPFLNLNQGFPVQILTFLGLFIAT